MTRVHRCPKFQQKKKNIMLSLILFLLLALVDVVVSLGTGVWFETRRLSCASITITSCALISVALLSSLAIRNATLYVASCTACLAAFAIGRCLVAVGLTGGVATGKSSVSKLLVASPHHFRIVDADEVAKKVRARGAWGYRNIVRAFGGSVLDADGEIDTVALRGRIFGDANRAARRKLNNALKLPLAFAMFREIFLARVRFGRCVIVDAPTLFESGLATLYVLSLAIRTNPYAAHNYEHSGFYPAVYYMCMLNILSRLSSHRHHIDIHPKQYTN